MMCLSGTVINACAIVWIINALCIAHDRKMLRENGMKAISEAETERAIRELKAYAP